MALNKYASLLLASFVATLIIAPVAPEAGNVLFLTIGIISALMIRAEALRVMRRPIVWMPLLGIVTIASAFFISSGLSGLVGVLYFAPVFCVFPLLCVAQKSNLNGIFPTLATFALAGASGAGFLAVQEVLVTGTNRAGEKIANPIHFADVVLLVGFIGVCGVLFLRSSWRFVFLLAPVAAGVAVVLSGTRGAIIAALIMAVVAVLGCASARLIRVKTLLIACVGVLIMALVSFGLGAGSLSGVQRVTADITETLANGVPTDSSTDLRLQMYAGGWLAFLSSPFFGVGPLDFVAVSERASGFHFGGAPHLHNDIINLAASGGVLGIIAYILIVSAPLVEVFRPSENFSGRRAALVLALVVGYITMGLTNAMFGILTVTTLFAVICLLSAVPE